MPEVQVPLPDPLAPGQAVARHEVVILGAGMSGLCMAIQLKRAGIDDFVIIEKQPGLGGTWWDNRYPGAPHIYSSRILTLGANKALQKVENALQNAQLQRT